MPVLPQEENAGDNLTESVMKNPSSNTESNASDHPIHHNEHGTGKAAASDFKSKGPQLSDSKQEESHCSCHILTPVTEMPEAASSQELKARAAELNK